MKNWFAGVFGLLAVAAMAAQAPAAVVLVTSTGNAATDASVESTLEAFGHAVTVGPQYFNLSGAGDFAGYEAVLLLANYNWQGGDMPAGAQSALVDFIGQGHGLVTGEWLVWKTADQQFATLRSAVPVQENDTVRFIRGTNPTIAYSEQTADPLLNAGLPASFAFAADDIGGMETFFEPKPGATAFYASDFRVNSSHGSGVIGWGYGLGRVISFSTPMGASEMRDAHYARLVSNALTWSASSVPEPSAIVLWSLGGAGIAGFAAMRRNKGRAGSGRSRAPWSEENRAAIHQIIERGRLCCVLLMLAVALNLAPGRASAGIVAVDQGIDNTLFRFVPSSYSPSDQKTWLKSNGSGNFFSAGLTNQRAQIQRGLIQFDFASAAIPSGAVVDRVSLRLYVLDVPTQTPLANPDFWLIALPAFDPLWGEGTSSANLPGSGAGSGANATSGDATWYHTQYDPANPDHYNAANTPPWTYDGTKAGFWPNESITTPAGLEFSGGPGALGDSPLSTRVGGLDLLNADSAYAAAGMDLSGNKEFVTWSTPQMASDIQYWLDNPSANFGWLVLGVEDQLSSKRGFASFENTGSDPLDGRLYRPTLTIEFHDPAVPEPATLLVWAGMGAAGLLAVWRRRRQA